MGHDLRDLVMVTTIVSSDIVDEIAKYYGVEERRVLTGFKYIGEQILHLEQNDEKHRFMFGFEESCGYLPFLIFSLHGTSGNALWTYMPNIY